MIENEGLRSILDRLMPLRPTGMESGSWKIHAGCLESQIDVFAKPTNLACSWIPVCSLYPLIPPPFRGLSSLPHHISRRGQMETPAKSPRRRLLEQLDHCRTFFPRRTTSLLRIRRLTTTTGGRFNRLRLHLHSKDRHSGCGHGSFDCRNGHCQLFIYVLGKISHVVS